MNVSENCRYPLILVAQLKLWELEEAPNNAEVVRKVFSWFTTEQAPLKVKIEIESGEVKDLFSYYHPYILDDDDYLINHVIDNYISKYPNESDELITRINKIKFYTFISVCYSRLTTVIFGRSS